VCPGRSLTRVRTEEPLHKAAGGSTPDLQGGRDRDPDIKPNPSPVAVYTRLDLSPGGGADRPIAQASPCKEAGELVQPPKLRGQVRELGGKLPPPFCKIAALLRGKDTRHLKKSRCLWAPGEASLPFSQTENWRKPGQVESPT
jgi:hypothetical protein